jgi:hypothetical protein
MIKRHNDVVDAVLCGIDNKKFPKVVGKMYNNLPGDRKLPDIEFTRNGQVWVLDVQFSKQVNLEARF